MNWKPGDVAIISNEADCPDHKWKGATITLTKFLGAHPHRYSNRTDWWEAEECYVKEAVLRKPYDGNKKTSWSDCIFSPKELIVLE